MIDIQPELIIYVKEEEVGRIHYPEGDLSKAPVFAPRNGEQMLSGDELEQILSALKIFGQHPWPNP